VEEELKKISEMGLQEMSKRIRIPTLEDVIRSYEEQVKELIKSLRLPAERGFPPSPA